MNLVLISKRDRKWTKMVKNSPEKHIYVTFEGYGLSDKTLRAVSREGPSSISFILSHFPSKKIDNKNISRNNFSFINPQSMHCFLKFLKKCKHFCCTGLLYSRKLVHFSQQKSGFFTHSFVQTLMNLVLISKSDMKWPKMIKTKIVLKNAYMWHSGAKV